VLQIWIQLGLWIWIRIGSDLDPDLDLDLDLDLHRDLDLDLVLDLKDLDPGKQKLPTKKDKNEEISCFQVLDVLVGGFFEFEFNFFLPTLLFRIQTDPSQTKNAV
jgi:hypothetical protein